MSSESGGRSAMVVGAGIFISRIVGLLRNLLFARYFGAGVASDAYTAAFKIPNAVRNLLGEGTLSAAFVPVYSRLLVRGDEKASRALAGAVLGLLLAAVSVLTIVGIAVAPLLTTVLAMGFDDSTQQLTTRLTRVLFPMTGLMVLSGWCLGIQNSHRRFFWSYASAALWSIAQIALLLAWGSRATDMVELSLWLAWATLVGAVLQVGAQMPEVMRLVWPFPVSLNTMVEGVKQTLRNVVPVVTALGVVQISSFVDLQIASWLPSGAATNMSYANTIALLPVSLFGVSVAAASLPEFSRDSGSLALDALLERLRGGWQRILFYIIPSTIAFTAFGDLCVGILYRGGKFGAQEQTVVHLVLAAFAVGLVSFASVKLLASAYYAMQDYKTPLRASISSIAVSTIASIAIAIPLRASPYASAGIALGTALGSYVNLSILIGGLHQKLGALYTTTMWAGTRRIVIASVAGAVIAFGVRQAAFTTMPTLHPRVIGPPILALFGIVYLLVAWWMGSGEAARWLRLPPRARSTSAA